MQPLITKVFRDAVASSLNFDQISLIGQMLDPQFDLRKECGFGSMIAIPPRAAADALVRHFKMEEDLIAFYECMLNLEGSFLFDGMIRVPFQADFIRVMASCKWIYDPDIK